MLSTIDATTPYDFDVSEGGWEFQLAPSLPALLEEKRQFNAIRTVVRQRAPVEKWPAHGWPDHGGDCDIVDSSMPDWQSPVKEFVHESRTLKRYYNFLLWVLGFPSDDYLACDTPRDTDSVTEWPQHIREIRAAYNKIISALEDAGEVQ